jgi:hypothetical protein
VKISFTRDGREDHTSWTNERTILKPVELRGIEPLTYSMRTVGSAVG